MSRLGLDRAGWRLQGGEESQDSGEFFTGEGDCLRFSLSECCLNVSAHPDRLLRSLLHVSVQDVEETKD